jgi:hypothetical protein
MRYEFLSDEWFTQVDQMIAAAGDLQIPPAMKAVDINVTIRKPDGETHVYLKDGLFTRGHQAGAAAKMTLPVELARKIIVDADVAAGVQGFLTGEIQIEGDLAKVVAMQTVEPSDAQKALTKKIASVTA